jgi:hypothetical protein
MADRKYTDTGYRGEDPRHGFGDDMGTRVGRPDGARATGNPSTNDEPVPDGIEGSILDEGEAQRDVQNASRGVPPERGAPADRRVDDV